MIHDDLILHQCELGMMKNFVYLLASRSTREAVLVDPAWDIEALLEEVDKLDLNLTHALVSHYHPDHIGGSMMGMRLPGVAELLAKRPVKVVANKHEAPWIQRVTGLSSSDLKLVEGGDTLPLGQSEIKFLHTPGHTPGSQCFLISNQLVSGDTLFLNGCGRTDFPGGDAGQLYDSLTGVLMKLSDQTVLLPGHNYGGASGELGEIKRSNYALQMRSKEHWLRMHGIS